jgi:protein arginine N-methyltransferase 1
MKRITGYRLSGYGGMITNKPRMEAYAQALKQVVTPESNVLDIGAGTGIFSLLACQLGARHVDAVEPDEAIKAAEVNAAANGCQDRITFHQGLSTSITLPEPADIVVSDLRSVLPLFQQHDPAGRHDLCCPGNSPQGLSFLRGTMAL